MKRRSHKKSPRRWRDRLNRCHSIEQVVILLTVVLLAASCTTTPEGKSIGAGHTVVSDDGDMTLRIGRPGWRQIPPSLDETETVPLLTLRKDSDDSLISVYRRIDASATLDGVVAQRRQVILDGGGWDFREKRRFLGEAAELTVSLSRYHQSGLAILVLTLLDESRVFELLGTTARGSGGEKELVEIMQSIRLAKAGDDS